LLKSIPWNDVRRTEGDLLGFGEEIVRIAVQDQLADRMTGTSSSGTSLVASRRRIQTHLPALGEHLQAEFVFRVGAGFDRLPQIASMEIRIGAGNLDRFIPAQCEWVPCDRRPVKFARTPIRLPH
jgi:hypothetical protein